ncbi:MAG: gamma carbonic anhydrase family protein [Candidatus Thermoplasmatota archaeon]|nr:gamma carbonic anhydrase family protein [Candidatus Thermoplasmatota archaeon]MBS3790049.1 gamma carbonic anhydrase family protein [Candidatus Thermoplasmatota archaeon]
MTHELEKFLQDDKDSEEDDSPFIDPTARTVGDVILGKNAFLFPGSIIEGEESEVDVGEDSIVMNKASVRGTEKHPTSLGKGSFISPGASLIGCDVGKGAMVGIDAVVLEGAEIGENAIVGTNAIVPEGMEVPDKKLVLGQPAEIVRDVSEEELKKIEEIRSDLVWRRKEFKMIEKRAERFNVNETPKRPQEILEENKLEMADRDEKDVPDLDEVRKKLKDDSEDKHIF